MTDRMAYFMREVEHAQDGLRYAMALGDKPSIIYNRVRLRKAEEEVYTLWRIEALDSKEEGR